jgi:HPt (histidine-containing phosphotransfer) domain-containing protein
LGASDARAGSAGLKIPEAIAMPLHLEQVDWMPSPPLAPEDGPLDIGHLRRMTLGDAGLEAQVLAMFLAQTDSLAVALAGLPPDACVLAHRLKGSARAIGAFRLADAAGQLEAAILHRGDPAAPLADLAEAIAQARSAIAEILRRAIHPKA